MRECIKCKSNEYTNKTLVMMINECGHPLCKNCVENLYARNAAPCHICGKTLRKNNFWEQTFDDPAVEKENHIRKRLRKIYNLREDDFPTLRDYNDYLEKVETLIMNLASNIDVEETENEIRLFQEQNSEIIDRNKKRLDADQMWIQQQLKEEREMKARLNELHTVDNRVKDKSSGKEANTKEIMKELMESNVAAEVILDRERKKQIEMELEEKEEAERKKKQKKERKRAEGVSFSHGPQRVAGKPFEHTPVTFEMNGPVMCTWEDIEKMGYLQFMRHASDHRRAGGYTAAIAAYRALLDARMDLLNGLIVD